MEPLRLFIPETLETSAAEVREQARRSPPAVPLEHLEAAEAFLEARSNVRDELPTIQAAIT